MADCKGSRRFIASQGRPFTKRKAQRVVLKDKADHCLGCSSGMLGLQGDVQLDLWTAPLKVVRRRASQPASTHMRHRTGVRLPGRQGSVVLWLCLVRDVILVEPPAALTASSRHWSRT
jgi:hypothetical protein